MFIETAARSNCAVPYSVEASPAICPMTVNQPHSQLISGTHSSGARYLHVKYMPPDVGYAETISDTDKVMAIQPKPEMSQDQTAEAAPPPTSG